jgi:hypothetical protein
VIPDRALKILAFLEAETVTGPAANLLQFHAEYDWQRIGESVDGLLSHAAFA